MFFLYNPRRNLKQISIDEPKNLMSSVGGWLIGMYTPRYILVY